MLGSALIRIAIQEGFDVIAPKRNELDLKEANEIQNYLKANRPFCVIHSAALVGGISANIANPVEYLAENIQIDNNLLRVCDVFGIQNLVYIGSSCMYPMNLPSPMNIDQLYSGKLEPTNEGYALAKLVGAKHVQYISETRNVDWKVLIPSNLYGPNDHFLPNRSHLIAAIIRKVVEAKITGSSSIEMWGDGSARREFTYVDDLAEFIINSLHRLEMLPIVMNIGSGIDYSVSEYYRFVMEALKVGAELKMDTSKPVGMSQKLLDVTVAKSHGWNPKTPIVSGIAATINWYLQSNGIVFADD